MHDHHPHLVARIEPVGRRHELTEARGRQRVQLRWPVQLDVADRVVGRHGQGLEVRHDETMPRPEGRYRPMSSTAPRIRERGWEPRGVVASFSPLWPRLEQAPLAQSAERLHGKEKVVSSILTGARRFDSPAEPWRRSSVGESARLIIERSTVRICPSLPPETVRPEEAQDGPAAPPSSDRHGFDT